MSNWFEITDEDIDNFLNGLDWETTVDCAGAPPAEKIKSAGCFCNKCKEFYEYAEPNQKDGSFKCFSCRNYR